MAGTWEYDDAKEQIDKRIEELRNIFVKDYKREMSLEGIKINEAYRVDGVHLYADILNLGEMLRVTNEEGETCHKRTLRFLDMHYRAVTRILNEVEATRVDFHNQRLHAMVAKPYDSQDGAEKMRIQKAVAIAQLIIDVLAQVEDDEEHLPAAQVRVGIDSGKALAVNNGRKGNRQPLFLGDPANHAAKMSSGGTDTGVYLTNNARSVLGLKEMKEPQQVPLTREEIGACEDAADLGVTADAIVKRWREDLEKSPLGKFQFSRKTPPLSDLEILDLTPGNSRRQDAVSIYADIDGFTKYVGSNIDDNAEDVVRTLHVVRAELERVLSSRFGGRRIRFIGDCLHGLLCEGTSQTTNDEESVSAATLLAGALRSSFELTLEQLQANGCETGNIGLAIGFEFGPMTITRLGIQGSRVRCSVSRGVLASEKRQADCKGTETAIGEEAYEVASKAVRELFGNDRKVNNLDYNEAIEALNEKEDKTAKASQQKAYEHAPHIAVAAETIVRPHSESPAH